MLIARRIGRRSAVRRRAIEYYCRIDVLVLWGVVFVLFVLVVTLPSPHHGMGPDLPKSLHARLLPAALRDDSMRITIARDGRYFFGSSQITSQELTDRIREAVRGGAERKVYLSVDARVKYRSVELVVEEIRRGGIENVSFLAWKIEER